MNDQFELLEQLGRGGMGVVWKARERATGRLVAIKVMHANFASDPGYRLRFEREVEIARRLHSPNIVEVLGYGSDGGTPYMVMELVEGESLRELLARRGHLGWEETRAILRQAAIALDVAHRANVIHRDVKPSNILITADGTVKLADFGIARAADLTALTGSSTMLGTSAYMAPDTEASPQGDLYSLGCVAYELLAGRKVFEDDSQQALVIRHIREAPDLSRLPEESRRIVGWLLQKDAGSRPRDAATLRAALEGPARPLTGTVSRAVPVPVLTPHADLNKHGLATLSDQHKTNLLQVLVRLQVVVACITLYPALVLLTNGWLKLVAIISNSEVGQ